MIGPTSETGKAMLQSLTQQIQGGMPVDQAIQYVKSQAAVGVAPLVDLYALLNQFQRMKQPAAQPPTGGTIKQQLDMVQAMNSGMGAPMQARPAQPQMMAQGLGGLDAGAMENPKFAAGGMVAFAEGDVVRAANVKQDMPKSWEDVYARAEQGDEVSIEMLRKERERQEALEKETQTGRYAPSLAMKQAQLEKQKAALATDDAERAALDEQAYWGDVAGYAAESGTREKKGPTFLTSMAMAQKAKAERARTAAEKKKEAQKAYDAAEIADAQAKEALRKGDLDTAQKKVAEAKRLRDEAVKGRIERLEQEDRDARTLKRELAVAAAQKDTPQNQLLRRLTEAKTPEQREAAARDIELAKGRDVEGTSDRANYARLKQTAYAAYLKAMSEGADEDTINKLWNEYVRITNRGAPKGAAPPPNVANPQSPTGGASTSNW